MKATTRLRTLIVARANALPNGWRASATAPDSYEYLTLDTARAGGTITVWTGESDRTVYGDPFVNHAMRAWHDSIHLRLGANFTLAGETATATAQAAECDDPEDGALIMADVLGQALYYERHGAFPVDQIGFVTAYMGDRDRALARVW